MFTGGRFFTKYIPNHRQSNDSQKESNLSLSNLWSKINHKYSDISSALTAKYQETITPAMSAVNINEFLVANIAMNHPATRFEQTAENIFNCDLLGSKENLIHFDINRKKLNHQYV